MPATLDEAKALVGGKAANLGVMARDLGLPVPPGFVITTATCRTFLATGWPDGLDEELRAQMAVVEAAVGRRFGDPSDPLLVSVRSGAPVSMPGMMDTILNLGLNDATEAGLARVAGDAAFARRCRERFVASYPIDRRRRRRARTIRGSSSASRSRPSSAPGRATARARIGRRRASRTTSAPP